MSAPVVQGWCPGAWRPMLSGDGYVLRIRPRLGAMSAAQAQGIAALARTYGNGFVQLTNRANVQIRGIAALDLPALQAGLAQMGLLDASAELEARRNITLSPDWGDATARAIASDLSQLLAQPDAPALPAKFGFVLEAGTARYLAASSGDIRLEPSPAGLILRADGTSGGRLVTPAEAAQKALDMAQWFVSSGGVGADGRGRMAAHMARGAVLPETLRGDLAPLPSAPPYQAGAYCGGFCVGFAFGQIPAPTLAALAKTLDDGEMIRLTPWRALSLQHPARLTAPDLITAPDDPRARIFACTGKPGCGQALGETRALAQALAAHLPASAHLHISGCAKGCAHPDAADFTLTATPRGYDLIRNGAADAPPHRRDLPLDPAAPALATLFSESL